MSAPREDGLPILRPKPQRHWQITPLSTEPPTPRSPSIDPAAPDDPSKPVPRSRSILNLTASTLFGIYAPNNETGNYRDDISQPNTPWGFGAMTPLSRRDSLQEDQRPPVLGAAEQFKLRQPPKVTRRQAKPCATAASAFRNAVLLLVLGVGYGTFLAQLHREAQVVPVRLEALARHSREHVLFWGVAAMLAGLLLPRLDRWWASQLLEAGSDSSGRYDRSHSPGCDDDKPDENETVVDRSPRWTHAIRCVGAFVGLAFAIILAFGARSQHPLRQLILTYFKRRLPWEPTLQVSLTLALSNPFLWYLVDGSVTGMLLSAGVGTIGAAAVVSAQPNFVAIPAVNGNSTHTMQVGALGSALTSEGISLGTWIGSALFYSCVCFGNIGRALTSR